MVADPSLVISTARAWIGTPYHDQASVKGAGCDCLGLARGVWREIVGREPTEIPPYNRGWGEVRSRELLAEGARQWMIEIDPTEIVPGAAVLFRMREVGIAKHIGILISENTFIHSYERLGVIEEPFSIAWRRRVAFAFLYPSAES